MVVVARLSALVIAASLVLAAPATAQEPGEPGSGGGSGGCSDANSGGNCTSPQQSNSTASGGQSNSTQPQESQSTCDLVRGTGGKPRPSVNPVLGIVTVDPSCIIRWIQAAGAEPIPPL